MIGSIRPLEAGIVVKNHVQQGIVDLKVAVVVDKAKLAELVHEKLTRDRVVPTISASVS